MAASPSTSGISADFDWIADYDVFLDQIATTDIVQPDTPWPKLRDMIKYKIDKNTSLLLQETEESQVVPLRNTSPIPLASGGLRLPSFPARKRDEMNPNEAPKSFMTEQEASELKGFIFAQLHEFDEGPPFTIQRVCELCLRPKEHYRTVGKYLRAVEKSLLVTSSWDAFPLEKESDTPAHLATVSMYPTPSTVPATPLFSPIPFLHDDPRRSKSRSPPPSPLTLSAASSDGAIPADSLGQKALGLVDELDDPSPGHMSEHPTALSSVTTTTTSSRPFLGSLEQRFTKSKEEGSIERDDDAMMVDEAEDKENKG